MIKNPDKSACSNKKKESKDTKKKYYKKSIYTATIESSRFKMIRDIRA